ncbi:hypothetical protein [Rhodococcus sp. USK13]|uniref:hypothetical protein n=1 Tax=Rhodococcus sp. USK13 TaxID=2806442 RepID=UPI001BCCA617|nr:hypothetical protein [Rhodococcus sp. USK13]
MPAEHPDNAAGGGASPNGDALADDPRAVREGLYVGEGIAVPVGTPRQLRDPGVGWPRIPEARPPARMVPAVQYTWTAQRGDVSRFSRLALWRFLRRPRIIVFFAVMVVAMAVALWGGEAELTGFFAGIVIALPLAVFVVVLRAQRTMVGPGARWASGINSFGMLLEDPVAQIVIGHGSIAKIEVDHGLVYLYVRGGMGRAACIPEALCPPEVRAYLLSMVDARSRSAREANSAQE